MQRRAAAGWVVAGVLAASGCEKKEEAGQTAPVASATAASTAQATARPSAARSAPVAASASASAPPFKLAVGRSAIPSFREWDEQKREVMVKGSSALGCETKMVREYLRVTCKGKNDSGGAPAGIKMVRGSREAQSFAAVGVISLILPVVEGTNFEAIFSWSDRSHPFTIKWPKGTKIPAVVGVFEGAKSPLDRGSGSLEAKLCECHKKTLGKATCDELLGAADEDCDRTWGHDCSMLLACSRGEPGAMPACRPGWVAGPPSGHCFQLCGAGKPPCPAGLTCQKDFSEDQVCVGN